MENFDALFEQYAENVDAEAKSASRGNGFTQNYEQIHWTGLETNKPLVFRAVGGPPNSNVTPYTAKTVTISWVVGDDGKRFKVVKPSLTEDPSYILNRIISKINQVKWVDNKKTFPVKESYPELFNLIDKNGLQEGDKRYIFERGWKGKEVLIINVIDRSKIEEHRNLKHTMLLAKSVNEVNGSEFVDEGISSFSINGKLSHLFRAYGSWEKYDIAITKTGVKDNPYIIINASHSPAEVARDYKNYNIVEGPLTEEEKSWESYDLSKIYKTTSVIKIYNRLRNTIKKIDYALGTNFYEDLETEYKIEKKRLEEESEKIRIEDENAKIVTPISEEEKATIKSTRMRLSENKENSNSRDTLPFEDTLDNNLREKIISAHKDPNPEFEKHWEIKWDCADEDLASCPECGSLAPYDGVDRCPACGINFNSN